MDMIAGNKLGLADVEFKTSGPFSGRPAMVFTGRHIMCTASSHPVPQELTFFWKGTFDSTVDPAHQRRTNRGRVIEQEVWALEWTQDTDDHIQVYKQGQDWGKCKGEAAPNEPIIVVGTLTGNNRTLSVYRDSDMSVISTVVNSDGPPLEAGIDKKICMGYAQWNYNALAPNALYDTAHWRGEFEKVVVYDKVLGEQEITQVVNSLHNPQASAPGPPAPAPGPPGQPVTATIASCTASSSRGHYVCDKVFDGVLAERGRGKDNNEWATEREGVGSWIELNFDHATKINAMKYANRDAWTTDGEANRRVKLEFSAGSPAFVELVQPSTVDDDWDQQYFFPDVETTFVKITVETVWGTFNNGAEEIEFSYVPQGRQATEAPAEWVQQTSTQCGSTHAENTAAEAAIGRNNMYSPGRTENSHLKDYGGQSKTLAQCQADCLANSMCRGIEVGSNSADPSHSASCSLMYSGTSGGSWSGSCWYIKKNGKVWKYE